MMSVFRRFLQGLIMRNSTCEGQATFRQIVALYCVLVQIFREYWSDTDVTRHLATQALMSKTPRTRAGKKEVQSHLYYLFCIYKHICKGNTILICCCCCCCCCCCYLLLLLFLLLLFSNHPLLFQAE